MQKRFVLVDHARKEERLHGEAVREVACRSYITDCGDPENYAGKLIGDNNVAVIDRTTGSTPYSFFSNEWEGGGNPNGSNERYATWLLGEINRLGSVKVVTHSIGPGGGLGLIERRGATLPFLVVQGAGNGGRDEFHASHHAPHTIPIIQAAIRANKVLYVAGHDRQGGRYIRHPGSSGCKGADAGCIWAPFVTDGAGGTSLSAPRVAAALASVLAVFPDTSHQNLAKFAKACALKQGQGIEVMLRQSGGVGVADFTCMGGVMTALANLPTGGSTTTTINGKSVSLTERSISLSFTASPSLAGYFPEEEKKDTFRFALVPTDGENFLLVGVQQHGDLFASAGVGLRDNFFGFSEGHGRVFDTRLEAGHQNAFIRLAQQHSEGGSAISSAQASTLGLTLQKEFQLAGENTTLNLAAHADKFLGGSAEIPYGSVNLKNGKWEHQVNLRFVHRF